MNIYKISQTAVGGYDTYDSAVVVARTKEEAANINPRDGGPLQEANQWSGWTKDPSLVKVELIGKAAPGVKAGVVVASFNAG